MIPLEEYLRTTTDPDCEFVDGVVEERAVGELDHACWQKALMKWFLQHEREWEVLVYAELRVQVSMHRFRVPDVTLLSRSAPIEQIVTVPPRAVFEVLSPEDSMTRILEKLADYERMGIGAIWVIEPRTRRYFLYAGGQLTPAEVFELPGGQHRVALAEIAAMVD